MPSMTTVLKQPVDEPRGLDPHAAYQDLLQLEGAIGYLAAVDDDATGAWAERIAALIIRIADHAEAARRDRDGGLIPDAWTMAAMAIGHGFGLRRVAEPPADRPTWRAIAGELLVLIRRDRNRLAARIAHG